MTPAKLTAAGSRYTQRRGRTKPVDQAWQTRAWSHFATPEVRFVASWIGNAMSRARLFAGTRGPDGQVTPLPPSHRASELVAGIAGGPDGQSELLKAFGPHLVVPGEGWVIIRPKLDRQDERIGEEWRVVSTSEVKAQGSRLTAEIDGTEFEIPGDDPNGTSDPDAPVALRVWNPHPERHMEADSCVRASLEVLDELRLLSAAVAAIARSRLTGRGIVLIPKGTRFPAAPGQASAEDDLIDVLIEVAETAYREPESAAATVPIFLEVPAETIAAIKRLTFESSFDDLAIKLREEQIRRWATGSDTPPEVLLGMGDSNHWCTVPDVEIMSASGWKTHDQLTQGEPVLTLNHETGLSEWQPLQAVNTWEVTDEPMVKVKGRRHTSLTTAAHRWPILSGRPNSRGRDWTTSGELAAAAHADGPNIQREEYILLAAPHADLPTEPKYSDALVELVAWYFTEGALGVRAGRRTPKVEIYQSHRVNPDNCARIQRALTALFGPVSDKLDKGGRYSTPEQEARRAEARRIHAENPKLSQMEIGRRIGVSGTMVAKYLREESKTRDSMPRWRSVPRPNSDMTVFKLNAAASEVILDHAPARIVDMDFVRHLTASQLELFIDTSVRGDGHYIGGTTPKLGQKDPRMIAAFELAVILSGRSSYRTEDTSLGVTANGLRDKTQHSITASQRTTFAPRGQNITTETYTGTIWCPTTTNGTWLARHEGTVFYTGNSAWSISEDAITYAIEPKLGTVTHALTTQWLRPLLESEGAGDADEVLVWYDTSPLRVRANRSQTALEVYDRKELSGAALRRETGFDEADAPAATPTVAAPAADGNQADEDQAPADLPVGETNSPPQLQPVAAAATPPATAVSDGLLAAADGLIWAALSHAGERLRRTPLCPRSQRAEAAHVEAAVLHTRYPADREQVDELKLLDGAWSRVPEIASRYGVEPQCLEECLHDYCRELITAGFAHDFAHTRTLLKSPCLAGGGGRG